MLESGTDPESYITEYTLVYEDKSMPGRSLDLFCFASNTSRSTFS